MSLLDALNDVKKENFDPNKGKISDRTVIPDGTYQVTLDAVTHGVRKSSSTDYIMFALKVITGKQAGQAENIFPTLATTTSKGNPMPDFVLARSIKTIKVIGAMVGLDVPDKCFMSANETENYNEIENVFQPYIGKTLTMTVKSSPNKKNPDRPYRNYSFAKLEQPKVEKVDAKKDPFAGAKSSSTEISDDDLPF